MSSICNAAIHLCRIRVTRLDALGNPTAGPNNVFVSDTPMTLSVKPNVQEGEDKTLVGGCDCIVAEYKGYDKLKRFDLELDTSRYEPGLIEMLIGASAITDSGVVVGAWWPSQISCSDPQQPNVCFEAWQDAWEDDHQASAPYQYLHWIFPSSYWQIGDLTLENDFNQPKITGFTRGNTNWGLGIYGDLPESAEPNGGFFFTDTIPTANCDYQSHAIT